MARQFVIAASAQAIRAFVGFGLCGGQRGLLQDFRRSAPAWEMNMSVMSDSYNPPLDALVVVHQDHELLLVDKPSGLLSVPGKGDI